MSRFYSEVKGSRGEASRCGSKSSGIRSHTRGWNLGVDVIGRVDDDGNDVFDVWVTRGSNSPGERFRLCTVTDFDHCDGEHGVRVSVGPELAEAAGAVNPLARLTELMQAAMQEGESEGAPAPAGCPDDVLAMIRNGGI